MHHIEPHYQTAIIGAGAAGLFAAAHIKGKRKTVLLEKMDKPGKKLLLSGSGQCNLTHAGDMRHFLACYGSQGKRIRSLLYAYGNTHMEQFFTEKGLPLIHREDGKLFPHTLSSQDVLALLLKAAAQNQVELRCNWEVTSIDRLANGLFRLTSGQHCLTAEKILVATGGCSFPKTGSDGSFFSLLEGLGVTVTPRRPSLVPLCVEEYPYRELSGISVEQAVIWYGEPDAPLKKVPRFCGSLLFTHRCFSGPVILNSSRLAETGGKLSIAYTGNMHYEELARHLLTAASGCSRQISTLLTEMPLALPKRLADLLCQRLHIDPAAKSSQLAGKQLKELARLLSKDSFTISGTTGFATAMATAGGVSLDAIHLRTMESKECPSLYLAGEAVDVDGDTGGYNIQFAYSSAACAAASL